MTLKEGRKNSRKKINSKGTLEIEIWNKLMEFDGMIIRVMRMC